MAGCDSVLDNLSTIGSRENAVLSSCPSTILLNIPYTFNIDDHYQQNKRQNDSLVLQVTSLNNIIMYNSFGIYKFTLFSLRFYFWGAHGVFAEVLFTGIWEFVVSGKWSLMGTSSIWSFLVYGLGTAMAENLYHYFHSKNIPLLARCCVYVLVTYTWELTCGFLFDLFPGSRNWDYSAFTYNFMGYICLEYAPIWFMAGLYFEMLMTVLVRLEELPSWKLRRYKQS